MTLALETEIVSTQYDEKTRLCTYIVERAGKRWQAVIPLAELDQHGTAPGHRQKRRNHLSAALTAAMLLPPSEELVNREWVKR